MYEAVFLSFDSMSILRGSFFFGVKLVCGSCSFHDCSANLMVGMFVSLIKIISWQKKSSFSARSTWSQNLGILPRIVLVLLPQILM